MRKAFGRHGAAMRCGRGAARGAAPVWALARARSRGVGGAAVARAQLAHALGVGCERSRQADPTGGGSPSTKTLGASAAEGRSWRGACRGPELGVAGTPGTEPRHRALAVGTERGAVRSRQGFGRFEGLLARLPGPHARAHGDARHDRQRLLRSGFTTPLRFTRDLKSEVVRSHLSSRCRR